MLVALRLRRICKYSTRVSCSFSTATDEQRKKNFVKKRRDRLSQPYVRTPINVADRLAWGEVLTHPVDHPKIVIRNMERKFLKEMMEMYEKSGKVSAESLTSLYKDAIKTCESEELTAQIIVDVLSSFMSVYDLAWIKREVVPLIPTVTDALDLCSSTVLRVCICAYSFAQEPLPPDINKFVLWAHDQLMKHPEKDDMEPLKMLTFGIHKTLALSSRWKEMLQAELKEESSFVPFHQTVINRAVLDQDFDLALTILGDALNGRSGDLLHGNEKIELFRSVNDLAAKLPKENLETFFQILRRTEFEMEQDAASAILEKWNKKLIRNGESTASGDISVITRSNHCSVCAKKMEEDHPITAAEIKHLRSSFYEKSFVGGDAFHKTDPQVIFSFTNWIKSKKPYDLIIDGLNAFHIDRKAVDFTKSPREAIGQQVLDLLDGGQKRGLIITKKNMDFQIPHSLKKECDVYHVQGRAADDCYTLYAALVSGPQCFLLSSDEFRDHSFQLLTPEDVRTFNLFNRWQRLRRVLTVRDIFSLRGRQNIPHTGEKYRFGRHLQTSVTAQCADGHWHIPIYNTFFGASSPRLAYSQRWLCLPTITGEGKRKTKRRA